MATDAAHVNEIPPMTHRLGAAWDQPPRENILIDDTYAVMDRTTFKTLLVYDDSNPSGVYAGKMWRRRKYLCWYDADGFGTFGVQSRVILVTR